MNKLLAETIKQLREAKRLTRKDMMELTGLSSPVVNKIEEENYTPSDLTIAKYAKALGVSYTDLLSLKGK